MGRNQGAMHPAVLLNRTRKAQTDGIPTGNTPLEAGGTNPRSQGR